MGTYGCGTASEKLTVSGNDTEKHAGTFYFSVPDA